jgi:lipid-binding SYLF domain-containing protein
VKLAPLTLALVALLPLAARSGHADPAPVGERVAAAAGILRAKQSSPHPIPQNVIDAARGVAIVSLSRGGFIFGGQRGTGLVIARTRGALGPSWSAPIAFNMSGGSFGAQIGYEKVSYIFILNTDAALQSFLGDDGAWWAAGTALAGVQIYTQADGVYGGATVGGVTLRLDRDANRHAYGDAFNTRDIINGHTQRPQSAAKLYELLNGVPEE